MAGLSLVDASPTARFLSLLVVATAIATVPLTLTALGLAALVVTGLCWQTGPDPKWLVRRSLLALAAIVAIVSPWALDGQAEQAALRGTRAVLCAIGALSLAATLSPPEVSVAMRALGIPEAFARVVATMLRQVSGLSGEGQRLMLARRLRGARGARAGVDIMAALLDRSVRRAERVELAERLRGYDLRRVPESARLRLADTGAMAVLCVLALLPHLGRVLR